MTKVYLIDGPSLNDWERAYLAITWLLRQNFESFLIREGRLSEFKVREFDSNDDLALRNHGYRVRTFDLTLSPA